jgi:hypothetical protein
LKEFFNESIDKITTSLAEVSGGSPTLGESWKADMSGSESLQSILKLADKSILKCYSSDITKRIAATETEVAAATILHQAFGLTFETPQKTVAEVCKGAASLLEGRILQNYRNGDLAKKKAYEKHQQVYTTCLAMFGISDETEYRKHVHATLYSHLLAIVKGST